MRIGLLDCALELAPPPPPLSLPPHAASSMAAAATVGANHPSLLIALLLTPLQTFAAIDCDRSGRSRGLSSANAAPWWIRGKRTWARAAPDVPRPPRRRGVLAGGRPPMRRSRDAGCGPS